MHKTITIYNPDTNQIEMVLNASTKTIDSGHYKHYWEGEYKPAEYDCVDGKPVKKSDAQLQEIQFTSEWNLVRTRRNQLLQASDFSQLPDLPDDKKPAWAEYRQKLRDITKDVTDPNTITFPDPPDS
tara:strand:- start:902 stop:1282 length:381 start_codon:yes stop_codon:yes gene_type:complete